MERIAKHAVVRGVVQGVGFRWHAKERARGLGLAGWVQNLPDGAVEAWVEGPPQSVDAFVDWIRHGPPAARVESVDLSDAPPTGSVRFEVRR
ncbi:MAG TPA: acylphosphatase [Planctomycetota bacterium]|nr:acylphosphatase [Planctomycetota bacterium]